VEANKHANHNLETEAENNINK